MPFPRIKKSHMADILLKFLPANDNRRSLLPPGFVMWNFWEHLALNGFMMRRLLTVCSPKEVIPRKTRMS